MSAAAINSRRSSKTAAAPAARHIVPKNGGQASMQRRGFFADRSQFDRCGRLSLDKSKMTGYLTSMPKPNVREQLITAGLETLHKHGFNGTGVQDITDAAGVPKGSFYNHFASKEALGAEAVRRYAAQNSLKMQVLDDASLAPLDRLRVYFASLADSIEQFRYEYGCLLGNFGAELANQSPLIRESIATALNGWTEAIARVIREAQAAGALASDTDPQALAAFMIDTWEGAVVRARVERGRGPLDNFLAITFAKILA